MKYLLYIFDLDGTIMDSRESIMSALVDTIREFGLPLPSVEKGRLYIGHTLEDVLSAVGISDMERGKKLYREYYYHYIEREKPFPGVPEMLDGLYQRTLMALSTNKGQNGARRTLEQNRILKYFDVIEAADTGLPKPHPASFHAILDFYARQGKHLEPADCLMVGDSPTDMEFARACGMDMAFVEWGFFDRENLPEEPEYVIRHPRELVELNEETVETELTPELDLHTFRPAEVKGLVENYLDEARRKGWNTVRIIHGKGKGVQREMVRKVVARKPYVRAYYDAPLFLGGLGATVVELDKQEGEVSE